MGDALRFEIHARSRLTGARAGRITTLHGSFETPAFMAVGTKGTVKGIVPPLLAATGTEVMLCNTYHLLLRPGEQVVRSLGGLHRFTGWPGPILTDSGGYQAYSMADRNAIDDDGVTFRSIVDGSRVRLTPERSIEVQNALGADIIMAFDDCPPSIEPTAGAVNQTRLRLAAARDSGGPSGYDHAARLKAANERTIRWLERCNQAHARPNDQALFGIVQGGTDLDARAWCVERVCGVDLPGYAIGGVAVGEDHERIAEVTAFTAPRMPEDRPRYLMGVGYERDLVAAVLAGVDMFDCVLPTRNGRNGQAFTRTGVVRLRNAEHATDPQPIERGCDCPACDPARHGWGPPEGGCFSRGYIRHLFLAEEMLGPILVSLHNIRLYQRLMFDIRRAVVEDDWPSLGRAWLRAAEGLPASLRS
ncbi:MAG TPA: tRNA guanosine(34) transglycosylase Tgt [Phycisphaerales bacterium]|nr:tRNA guanosine(34) transglycosylase Tgt [Phycisphaerales bacterium]